MSRKLKPQFKILGIIISIAVIGIFVFLFILVSDKTNTSDTYTQTVLETETTIPIQLTETEPVTYYHESVTIPEPESLEQIIVNEGLRVRNGKVTNADGIEYTVNSGSIKLIYNDNLYTISVDMIKKVTEPATEKPTQKPTQKPTEKATATKKSSSSASSSKTNSNSYSSSSSQSSNSYTPSPQLQEPIIEQPAVEKPVQRPTEKPKGNNSSSNVDNSIHMNYKSLTINRDTIFTLTLSGVINNVVWYISDSSIINEYEKSGNQCSFSAESKGQAKVMALCYQSVVNNNVSETHTLIYVFDMEYINNQWLISGVEKTEN